MSFIDQIPDLIDALMSFVVHLDKYREFTLIEFEFKSSWVLQAFGLENKCFTSSVGRHTQRDTFNSCFR